VTVMEALDNGYVLLAALVGLGLVCCVAALRIRRVRMEDREERLRPVRQFHSWRKESALLSIVLLRPDDGSDQSSR
jgi:hypothetical protein